MSDGFPAGLDDVAIVPLSASAFVVWQALRRAFFILVDLVDFLFPILLQLIRFPLFTLRILGDGSAMLLNGIVRILPVGHSRQLAWHAYVTRRWAWLRRKISYQAFEEALYHAFEKGMAWVFESCRRLTPRAALLVIVAAVLWLPISFGVATAIHVALIAKAAMLPAWMQLLHPVAAVLAKTKLLVLPVYPAAWPQAKQHGLMQALTRFWNALLAQDIVRKIGRRYLQIEAAVEEGGDALRRTWIAAALSRGSLAVMAAVNLVAVATRRLVWAVLARLVETSSRAPLLGDIVAGYAAHYDHANRAPAIKFSKRVRAFFERWSVKFTPEYYETKAREDADGHAAP